MKKGYCPFCESNVESRYFLDVDGMHLTCYDCGTRLSKERDIEKVEEEENKEGQSCLFKKE